MSLSLFFFNDTATTEIYTLSLHDALPISEVKTGRGGIRDIEFAVQFLQLHGELDVAEDRKSTRLNSSHVSISYAVFCLKKKKIKNARCQCCYHHLRSTSPLVHRYDA